MLIASAASLARYLLMYGAAEESIDEELDA